jgi:hypothetical protein
MVLEENALSCIDPDRKCPTGHLTARGFTGFAWFEGVRFLSIAIGSLKTLTARFYCCKEYN